MSAINRTGEPFNARFIEAGEKLFLELANMTDQAVQCVEILTVFLKDEETPGGPSKAHIIFEEISHIRARERAILAHRTWINGRPAGSNQDQLKRLQVIAGAIKPYVLDISWEDVEGKSQFQRIAVGH